MTPWRPLPGEQSLSPRTYAVADTLGAVRPAAEWVDAEVADANLSAELVSDLHVCLEEALANLIMHGRARGDAKNISIEVHAVSGEAIVIVRDECAPFDVTDAVVADAHNPMQARVGGQGVRLLRAFATELDYESHAGFNELRIVFRGPNTAADAAESAFIRAIPAFAHVSNAAAVKLANAAAPVNYQPGDMLLNQGDPSTFALILVSGDVAVVNQSAHGEAPVARISAPALIGEIGALAGFARTAGVRAMSDVSALRLDRAALLEAGRVAPDLLISVIGQLGQQIQSINGAVGLYAAGLAALEADALDAAILGDLNNPTPELANFADAFRGLARRVTHERRTRGEMASAAAIQSAMLPQPISAEALAGRCDVHGAMKSARHIGGDLYDLFMLDDKRLAFVVGDVCGKGVPAALFMSVAVTALRLAARQTDDLSALISLANDALCSRNATSMFATLFYGVLDLDTRRLDYVNCGHNPPFHLRPRSVEEIDGNQPPLGIFEGRVWPASSLQLAPGEGLFLFSDGVTECIDVSGEQFGEARLAEVLRKREGGAKRLVQSAFAVADTFAAGLDQFDDMTAIAILLR